MSKISRRIGAAAASVALAGGIGLATVTPAHAYDLVSHYSASQVKQLSDGIDRGINLCDAFSDWWSLACEVSATLSANAGLGGAINNAAANGCGLTVYVTATGSQMSYDKATYDYALDC